MNQGTKSTEPIAIGEVLKRYRPRPVNRSIAHEFQDYGIQLARELGDEKRKGLYIKLAKHKPRHLLERARAFVKDSQARHPSRLFLWKLKQLENKSCP